MADAPAAVQDEEPLIPTMDGAGNPPEPGYVRLWWVSDKNTLNFYDVPLFPDITFRDLRVLLSEKNDFPLLGFGLTDLDGNLYPLNDHPEEGQKIICSVGPSSPDTAFGPYMRERDLIWLRIADCLYPATIIGVLHVLSTSWLEAICFRRIHSLSQGKPAPVMSVVRNVWVTQGPGAFARSTGPIIVHYLATTICTQFPKAMLYGGMPTPFLTGVMFRLCPSLLFLLAAPLHRGSALPLPKSSFLSQLFYLPSGISLDIARRDFVNYAPIVLIRELIGSVLEEQLEEHNFLGKWLQSKGQDPSTPTGRLAISVLKVLLLQPLYTVERYGLFTQPDSSWVDVFKELYSRNLLFSLLLDGLVTELVWLFFSQRVIGNIPLTVAMRRINSLSRKHDDSVVVRKIAVESMVAFGAAVAFFAGGTYWFWTRRQSS